MKWRLLMAVLAALIAPAARATLAVAVPSRSGLVIAADSRITFMGAPCDGAFKILIPVRPARTVAVVTGDGVFVAPPPHDEDPCRYLAKAPRLLDVNAVITQFLNRAGNDPARIDLSTLAAACVQAVEQFRAAHPAALRPYTGRAIFSVLVASYDPASHTSTLRNFLVRATERARRIEAARLRTVIIGPNHPRGVWIYGETDWVNRNVYTGFGRAFLSSQTLDFLRGHEPAGTTPTPLAAEVAANVIDAASRAATSDPPPSGIGGAVRVVVLGRGARPERYSAAARP